ncbi:MAG TPA: serine hydrolase domain-containing protein [Acidimicrobiales bacterium]|nr:serine hydrolase domain-containing protein [Acidimicrobiales bacterium]
MERLLRQGIDEGLHLGAQLVVRRHGDTVFETAVGESRPGVPMRPDAALPWHSISKVVTALAVARQWERRAIGLDDPVASHLPAFSADATVRHLLTHTGGLRNAELAAAETDGRSWRQSLEIACAAGSDGRRARYQPRGAFLVLAELVRLIDGRPFDEYAREDVLRPLGLERSGFLLPAEPMYDTSGDEPTELPAADAVRPSSGVVGPAADLALLFERVRLGGDPVVSTPVVEAMTARHRVGQRDETFGVVLDWGLGFIVNSWQYQRRPPPYGFGNRASPRAFGHGGSESSIAFADPEHGVVVALVCNGMPGEKVNHRRTQPVLDAVFEGLDL